MAAKKKKQSKMALPENIEKMSPQQREMWIAGNKISHILEPLDMKHPGAALGVMTGMLASTMMCTNCGPEDFDAVFARVREAYTFMRAAMELETAVADENTVRH